MRAEQSVIDLDVDWWNLDLPPRQNRLYQILLQVLEPGSAAAFNPVLQSLFDFPFPFLGRQLQDPQILSVRRLWTILSQLVVGDSEQDSGKEIFPPAIAGKGSRLSHQRVDHVPVIDPVLSFPPQSRHLGYSLPAITNFHMIGIQSRLHLFADQAAVHRVGVVAHSDRGTGCDLHSESDEVLQATIR